MAYKVLTAATSFSTFNHTAPLLSLNVPCCRAFALVVSCAWDLSHEENTHLTPYLPLSLCSDVNLLIELTLTALFKLQLFSYSQTLFPCCISFLHSTSHFPLYSRIYVLCMLFVYLSLLDVNSRREDIFVFYLLI